MKPLTIKLFRDLWRLRAQSAAIALVIAAGVAMVVMSFGMIRSLEATRAAYYDRYRFADVFAPVRRAPNSVIAQVRGVPGVAFAEGRVSTGGILDVPGIAEPVSARIHSLPPVGGLSLLVLRNGRFHWRFWMIFHWLFWLVFLALVVWAGMVLSRRSRLSEGGNMKTPRDLLDERYARGEIDREEYLQRRKDIEER